MMWAMPVTWINLDFFVGDGGRRPKPHILPSHLEAAVCSKLGREGHVATKRHVYALNAKVSFDAGGLWLSNQPIDEIKYDRLIFQFPSISSHDFLRELEQAERHVERVGEVEFIYFNVASRSHCFVLDGLQRSKLIESLTKIADRARTRGQQYLREAKV